MTEAMKGLFNHSFFDPYRHSPSTTGPTTTLSGQVVESQGGGGVDRVGACGGVQRARDCPRRAVRRPHQAESASCRTCMGGFPPCRRPDPGYACSG